MVCITQTDYYYFGGGVEYSWEYSFVFYEIYLKLFKLYKINRNGLPRSST
jgi:hypothetical protein